MDGAARMDENFQLRILSNQGAGCAGVIEMDVGEEDGVEIGDTEAMESQRFAQNGESGGRAGVDDCAEAVGAKERRRDGAGLAAPE